VARTNCAFEIDPCVVILDTWMRCVDVFPVADVDVTAFKANCGEPCFNTTPGTRGDLIRLTAGMVPCFVRAEVVTACLRRVVAATVFGEDPGNADRCRIPGTSLSPEGTVAGDLLTEATTDAALVPGRTVISCVGDFSKQ
jgi:hypothetical protein